MNDKMNTKNIIVICIALILIGLLFWPTLYRYEHMIVNGTTLPVKIFRLTGSAEVLYGSEWVSHEKHESKIIPEKERKKISVKEESKMITVPLMHEPPEKDLFADLPIVNEIPEKYPPANAPNQKLDKAVPSIPCEIKAKVYNGSRWTITDMIIRYKADAGDDTLKLKYSIKIQPLSMGDIVIDLPMGYKGWEIDEIKGYKE